MNRIVQIDGMYWPENGVACRDYTIARGNTPNVILKHVKNFDVCIHAGANVGIYTRDYAKVFENVYVWEPDVINFRCLNLNILDNNVFKFQGVLGCSNFPVSLDVSSDTGAHTIHDDPSPGNTLCTKIDDLNLVSLDLLHLDVEGAERMCMLGAQKTLLRLSPVVAVETCWSNSTELLISYGYEFVEDVNGDSVFKKCEQS